MGRPSLKTPELIEAICDAIADGQSLRQICEHDTMPTRQTVRRWLEEDAVFVAKHARAREAQADVMDEKIAEVAAACTAETAAADRVKIGAYQWRAERLNARRYGPKVGIGQAEGLAPVAVHVIERRVIDANAAD